MRFIDEVTIRVAGGAGGNGHVGWRREKYVPRGGPQGGDGGNGGAIVFVAEPGLNTLIDFAFSPELQAQEGANGGRAGCAGPDGADTVRKVPVGTQVFFGDQLVADLSVPNSRWIAARGGHGGKGNAFFRSSTNQAPEYAEAGQPGEQFELRLVLKSVADVGLVGLPNVGKSTFISKISRAQPKIADYPFTTLAPHLGVVIVNETRRFVIADIPGLIPGAHLGKGLGIEFLKHVERTSLLVQLIDVSSPFSEGGEAAHDNSWSDERLRDYAIEQFEILDQELKLFSEVLGERKRLVAFSKGDLPQSQRAYALAEPLLRARGMSSFLFSSVSGEGLDALITTIDRTLQAQQSAR